MTFKVVYREGQTKTREITIDAPNRYKVAKLVYRAIGHAVAIQSIDAVE